MPPSTDIATLGGQTMGTTWSVRLVVAPHADLHRLHAEVQAALDLVVTQMSTWLADSDISRYNRAAPGSWQRVPAEFAQVLQASLTIAALSDGAFDPSIGPAVALWGFGAQAQARRVPDADSIRGALAAAGWRRLLLREDSREVLQPGGIELDFSAIAKGYAVDLVATRLRAAGIASALVEVGGELAGHGRKPDGQPWRVLVESAPDEDAGSDLPPRVLALDGCAVATSGDRWHRYDVDGQRYSHTLDPRSGAPVAQAAAAVTVVADDAMHADAWATAMTVLGAQQGLALANRLGLAVRFLSRDDGQLRETLSDAFDRRLEASA